MQIEKLKDIATVQIISLFRDKAPDAVVNGNAHVLLTRDLVNNWPLDFGKLTEINAESDQLKMSLQQGDILIPARGDYYPARHLIGVERTLFAAGQINVIRTISNIDSGYLAWYLNQHETQSIIKELTIGTSIRALNKASLLQLEIKVISLEKQKKISDLQKLSFERSSLMKELIFIKEIEISNFCSSIFTRETV